MGAIRDWRNSLLVRATTKGYGSSAELNGRGNVWVEFPPGVYRSLTESALERELAQLARALLVRRTASYEDLLATAFGPNAPVKRPAATAEEAAMDRESARLVTQGASADGRVRISLRGGSQWRVEITPGTVRALREMEFSSRVSEAAEALIRDQAAKTRELRARIYGPTGSVRRAR